LKKTVQTARLFALSKKIYHSPFRRINSARSPESLDSTAGSTRHLQNIDIGRAIQ